MALKVIGKGFTLGFAAESTFESISRAVDAYEEGTLSWWNALDVGFNTLGFGLAVRGFKGTFGDALAGKAEPGIIRQAISWGRNKFNFGNTGSSSSGYYYHVTTEEYARQIIESGELRSGDGRIINVRNISSEGSPTIEIQNGKNKIKFRYKEFK